MLVSLKNLFHLKTQKHTTKIYLTMISRTFPNEHGMPIVDKIQGKQKTRG